MRWVSVSETKLNEVEWQLNDGFSLKSMGFWRESMGFSKCNEVSDGILEEIDGFATLPLKSWNRHRNVDHPWRGPHHYNQLYMERDEFE